MITAKFYRKNGLYTAFIVSGHAGAAEFGYDIVCSGVSSAVMLTINTITDFFRADAKVKSTENKIGLLLNDPAGSTESRGMIFSLKTHLELLAQQYGRIEVLSFEC